MGLFKMISSALGISKREARIVVVGLDNSGKTTMIQHLRPKKAKVVEVTPTVGFAVEEFSKNNVYFTVYDMSGQGRYRSLWEQYYSDVQAIIFVLDSTDKIRLVVAKDEIKILLDHPDIKSGRMPILFFANKIDIPGACSPEECMEELELDKIKDRAWHIEPSNAVTGDGVSEGIEWLCNNLERRK